jgi:D-lactate dehydrogenase
MGISHQQDDKRQLTLVMESLAIKAGYEVIYPRNVDRLCCGMAFMSKGYAAAGRRKSDELENALLEASNNGEYPVVCDMSPCLFTMRENIKSGLRLYEPVEFILDHLLERLNIVQSDERITVFPVCSLKKMGLDSRLEELARICSSEVSVADTNCCGFAGDRGFTYPELNRHGLRDLKPQIPEGTVRGYSTSRTCEIGLSLHSGITYSSIVYLVDSVSSPARQ